MFNYSEFTDASLRTSFGGMLCKGYSGGGQFLCQMSPFPWGLLSVLIMSISCGGGERWIWFLLVLLMSTWDEVADLVFDSLN